MFEKTTWIPARDPISKNDNQQTSRRPWFGAMNGDKVQAEPDAAGPNDGQQLQDFLRQISQRPGLGCFSRLLCAQPSTLEWDFSVNAGQKQILSRMSGRARPGEAWQMGRVSDQNAS
eukprot:s928_g5.t1